jgi:hypothetical protein
LAAARHSLSEKQEGAEADTPNMGVFGVHFALALLTAF